MKLSAVWVWVLWALPLGALPLPPPLETAHLLGRGLAATPPVPLVDEFYALGWSRSNAFAYLERRSVGPGRWARFRVVDLVDDRVLYESEWPDTEGPPDWWATKETQIEGVFGRFGLVPNDYQLGLFPLILDNEFYTLVLRAHRTEPAWIDRLEVVTHSTGRGLKVVSDAGGAWRWATLLGFVPSPFENRLALILLVQPAGWAGDRQPLRFAVAGLSLKAGFPKP